MSSLKALANPLHPVAATVPGRSAPHPGMDAAAALLRLTATDASNADLSCATCSLAQVCVAQGMDVSGMEDLHVLVAHIGPLHAGDHIFRAGDPFGSIFAVRAGTVKTYSVDREGREQVLGFHLAGEVMGLDAIDEDWYQGNAVALDTVMLCQFSFPRLSMLAAQLPRLQSTLFRLLSRDIGRAALLAGDWSADERMAAFLIGLSRRVAARGYSPERFDLAMARFDIANYLRLAPETVSRVLKHFQEDGLIRVDRRQVELLDRERLEALGASALQAPVVKQAAS